MARELHRIIAQDQPYTFLYEPLKPFVFDKRIAFVDRAPDGRETIKKLEVPPSGNVMYHLHKWRKLRDVPQFSVQ